MYVFPFLTGLFGLCGGLENRHGYPKNLLVALIFLRPFRAFGRKSRLSKGLISRIP